MGVGFQITTMMDCRAVSNLAYQKYALYKINGDGSFTYATDQSGLGRMTYLHAVSAYGLLITTTTD